MHSLCCDAASMDISPFLALLPIVLLSLVFFLSTGTKSSRPSHGRDGHKSLPPSPPGFPLLGHLPLLIRALPHRKLQSMAASYGPVMLLRMGRVPTVVASSAAAAQEAMKTRDVAFASRGCPPMAERLFYGRDMAFAPYGEHWRRTRRVCVLHLLSHRCVLSFRRVREQETAALLDRVRAAAGAGAGHDAAVNLSHLIVAYSSGVLLRAAFGGDGDSSYGLGGEGGERLRRLFADFEELLSRGTVGEFVPWLAWVDELTGVHAKAARTFEALDGLLERIIADHRKRRREGDGGGAGGFLSVLLDVSEEEEQAGGLQQFDTVAIKALVMNMFIAGSDTSSAILEWAMAELISHPNEMHKLQTEIRAAMNGHNRVSEDHLDKLHHLKAVLKETLRLHTAVPLVPRETTEDTELLGYHVPARTSILINIWAIARDPATWERAEEFLPERWLAEDKANVDAADQYAPATGRQDDDFTFLPFGGGRRGCPGAAFGMMSVELALASLLYHFDWELPAGDGRASTVNMDEQSGMVVRLKEPLHLVAKPWSPKPF